MDGLSDLRTCFDGQFSDNSIRRFLHLDAETGDCPLAQDVVPMRDDMRNAHIV